MPTRCAHLDSVFVTDLSCKLVKQDIIHSYDCPNIAHRKPRHERLSYASTPPWLDLPTTRKR